MLATGFETFDARRIEQYGYGRLANVFTSLEFERMSNASGPTGGRIVLRDGVTEPKSVAIVHCVGSRDRNFNAYCSAICCMQSLKFAHLVREHTDATVYEFYIDIRAPGKGFDEFYQRVQEEGTCFIRGRVAEITDVLRLPEEAAEDGRLIVQVEDTLAGRQRRIPVDMVVLSVGLEPQPDAHEVARRFGITCSSDGWVIERHPKLDPVATMTEGVFAAGCALGPRDIPASVTNGAAAAARILGRIQQREMALEPVRAIVDAGPLLRLPDLQRPLPVQRDRVRRGPRRDRGEPGALPGLRRVRRGLPGRGDPAAPASATRRSWARSKAC